MARLHSIGFELQSVTSGVEWDTTTGSPTIDTTTKRSGAASLRCNPTAAAWYIRHQIDGNTGDKYLFVRFYLYITTSVNGQEDIFRIGDSAYPSEPDVMIRLNTNDTLELWNGNTLAQIGSDSSALNKNQWYRIEIKVQSPTNTATNRTVEAKIDGTVFATSAIQTLFTSSYINFIQVGIITASTTDIYIDDIAVNDDAGTVQTSYPGAGSIVHMHPDSAGDAAATTGLFSALDEVTPNDATDYVEQDTIAEFDYNFEASSVPGIGASDTITLVQIGTRQHPETAAAAGWTPQIKSQSGGTTLGGTATTHNDTTWRTNGDALPRNYKLTSYVDPQAGGAWTPALLDTMIAGVNVTDATPNMFFSTIWALVEYVPAAGGSAIKTINGLAKASVKTVNGLAIASVKTWNGLA